MRDLDRYDARAKLAALLAFLLAVATTPQSAHRALLVYTLLAAFALLASGKVRVDLWRSALVLPFSLTFAVLTWWAGDRERAVALLLKAYLSGLATAIVVSSTPMNQLSWALESWRAPRTLVLVIQFLYRYLFVIQEQAQQMRWAAASRRGQGKAPGSRFQAAAGAVGVLFARSWERADRIHHAMLSRGFQGHMPVLTRPRFRTADHALMYLAAGLCAAIRLTL